jgi:hypothetical protein
MDTIACVHITSMTANYTCVQTATAGRLLIKPLILLGPWEQGRAVDSFEGAYGPVMLSGLGIEVDTGANIVYRK